MRQGPVQMCKGTSSRPPRTRQQPHSEELHHWVGERGRPSRPEVCHYSTQAPHSKACVCLGGWGRPSRPEVCHYSTQAPHSKACVCLGGWGREKEEVRGLRGFCQRLKHAAARLSCRLRPIGHITHKTSFARCVCVLYSAFPALYIYMLRVLCCLAFSSARDFHRARKGF